MRLLAIGLNPVLQKTLIFEQLRLGKVNRAKECHLTAGGKGIHFARAAHQLLPGCATVAHFLGGQNGAWVDGRLQAEGIPQLAVATPGETRICTTLLSRADQTMTELIDPSPAIPPAAASQMTAQLMAALPGLTGLAFCGTYPPGIEPALYCELARRRGQALLLLDAYKEIHGVLEAAPVDILKINVDEALELTGASTPPDAAAEVRRRWRVDCLALTDGPEPGWVFADGQTWRVTLPRLPEVVNPIGAGDTVAAVTLLKRLQGATWIEAFAWGQAAASASCLSLEGARFTTAEMNALRPQITVTPVA